MIKTKGKFVYEECDGVQVLFDPSGTPLMTDIPKDVDAQRFAVNACAGRILTAGLGLGLFAESVAAKDDVVSVLVIEKSQEVIDLINLQSPKISIVCGDIFVFLSSTKLRFDSAYFDIWPRSSRDIYEQVVLPLRGLASRVVKHIYCYKEAAMKRSL